VLIAISELQITDEATSVNEGRHLRAGEQVRIGN
jgi:hypothetical protein